MSQVTPMSNRTPAQILADVRREQGKLNKMSLDNKLILQQSQIVDELMNEYYRAIGR